MPLSNRKAFQACRHCRRLKRKCTRDLPACSLCVRLSKSCEYPDPTADDDLGQAELCSRQSTNLPLIESGTRRDFPSAYFLDPDFFSPLKPDTFSSAEPPFLGHVLAFLEPKLSQIHDDYFSTVHTWWPMVSRKRLLSTVNSGIWKVDDGEILLRLCMDLLSNAHGSDQVQTDPAASSLYFLVKSCAFTCESRGSISLRLIQSLVLLAMYELGHSIYPAAYLTIGQAARLSELLGMHDRKHTQQLFKTADTPTLREEQRRTWWAIFILDKYVNMATNGMPLAVPEPCSDDLLPMNDDIWNNGDIGANESLLTTTLHSAETIGQYAKACQAAHILGKVFIHRKRKQHPNQAIEVLLEEALQLHRTLHALSGSLLHDLAQRCNLARSCPTPGGAIALALCSSARFLLYNMYGCNEPDGTAAGQGRIALETEMQGVSLEGIRQMASSEVPRLAIAMCGAPSEETTPTDVEPGPLSPLLAHCLYHAATECSWFIREDDSPEMHSALRETVAGLRYMASFWKVGERYLDLLQQGDVLRLIEK
ncbi:fungal-specific transcription factor domain-containing protein [Xylariales sp. PMI_506]|nr:fungal-specific transcription factor domain-containing protein [Xylariales sp. PMI_506]